MTCWTSRLRCVASGSTGRMGARARRGIATVLHAVLRTGLLALPDARGVERAADDVVAHAGQVPDAAATDEDDRVLLEVVALARDVAVTSIWLVSRTRQTLRRAELGFFGVVVYTRTHTPRRWGAAMRRFRPWPDFRPGRGHLLRAALLRPLRIS